MGATYITAASAWPTFADGKPLTDATGLSILNARADMVDRDVCESLADYLHGDSLVGYGRIVLEENAPEDFEPDDEETDEVLEQAAMTELRKRIKTAMAALFDSQHRLDLSFDGLRWTVTAGGMSWGDSPSDEFDWVRLVGESGICEAPLDAAQFIDTAAVAAAVAVLDDLAATALAALVKAGLSVEMTNVAAAALGEARNAVLPTAKLLRYTLDQLTAQRTADAFKR